MLVAILCFCTLPSPTGLDAVVGPATRTGEPEQSGAVIAPEPPWSARADEVVEDDGEPDNGAGGPGDGDARLIERTDQEGGCREEPQRGRQLSERADRGKPAAACSLGEGAPDRQDE